MNTPIHSQLLEQWNFDTRRHFQTSLAAHPLLERTAFHEAGHAVVFLLTGREVQRVWIDAAGTGECIPVPTGLRVYDLLDKNLDFLFDQVKRGLAGPIAELILCLGDDEELLRQCTIEGGDMSEARKLLAIIVDDQEGKRRALQHGANGAAQERGIERTEYIDLYLGWEWIRTIEMLLTPTHWRAVKKIAQKLMQQRDLSGRTVHSLFTQVTKQKPLSRSALLTRLGREGNVARLSFSAAWPQARESGSG